ncbi:MAG: hypothetical protein NTY20_02530, partial [Candidatus Aenigmarchaeota archaeon]|nr:hypothetical protein [Candidatus Aenigmarchaeota archaeon]
VESIKQKAAYLEQGIDRTESHIYEVSIVADVSAPRQLFEDGLKALRNEEYEKAEELFSQANSRLEELQAEASMERAAQSKGWEGVALFLESNMLLVLACILAFITGTLAFLRYRKRRRRKKRLDALRKEDESINRSIKELQEKYFGKGLIDKNEYESALARSRKRLASVKRKVFALESASRKKKKEDVKPD